MCRTRRVLSQHARREHGLEFADYVVRHELGAVWPTCAREGCDERVKFFSGKFKTYCRNGHQGRPWTEQGKLNGSVAQKKYIAEHPEARLKRAESMRVRWRDDHPKMLGMLRKNMEGYLLDPKRKAVWRGNISRATAENARTGRTGHVRGWRRSTKMGFTTYYRSSWELLHMERLDADPSVTSWLYEPFIVPYEWDGAECHYLPDFIVSYVDGRTEMHEVGVRALKESDPKGRAKLRRGRSFCEENGMTFRLLEKRDC